MNDPYDYKEENLSFNIIPETEQNTKVNLDSSFSSADSQLEFAMIEKEVDQIGVAEAKIKFTKNTALMGKE